MIFFSGFLWFWGICFMITTTLVAIFKHEADIRDTKNRESNETQLNIADTYKLLFEILKMRPIQILVGVLLTIKVTFAASDAVTQLKLIDAGVPKDKLALLAVPMVPLQIILPLVISKYTTGPRPMEVYLKAIPYRIFFATLFGFIVYLTPWVISNGEVPMLYYVGLVINYSFYQICLYSMFVAIMAFFAKISDPAVGGTYMTLLNTVTNLGNNWPITAVLWLVDILTWRDCIADGSVINSCSTKLDQEVRFRRLTRKKNVLSLYIVSWPNCFMVITLQIDFIIYKLVFFSYHFFISSDDVLFTLEHSRYFPLSVLLFFCCCGY